MMKLKWMVWLFGMSLLVVSAVAEEEIDELELGVPFGDHAILQRGVAVPVWGWSVPGRTITVQFAEQTHTTEADTNGKWVAKLAPLEASAAPAEMVIRETGGATKTLKDILVGEVWHASGQSNMEWVAGKSMCRDLARELSTADPKIPIRELRTDTVSALYPQTRGGSEQGWKTIGAASQFSALALAFAHELHRELKVPVGILLTSHSNTRIEAFTERTAIEAHGALAADAKLARDADVTIPQGEAAFENFYDDLAAWQKESATLGFPLEKPLPQPKLPGIAGMWRGPTQFFNGKISPVVPYAIRGSIWCQGTSNSGDGRVYAARMEALVRGWREAWGMPAMPFYFTQMPCYGSEDPSAVGFADIRQAQHLFFINNRENVGMVVQSDLNPGSPGAIHYYNKLHPGMRLARWALAKDYDRDIAHTGPIYSGHEIRGDKVIVSFEADSLFCGLMVGSKGQEKDRTPGAYVEPAKATPGDALKHFRLCGADRKWHPAEAVIEGGEGETVVVRSPAVPKPIGVQYAYSASPIGSNLYNREGLPATPFAAIDGELIFEEDDPEKVAALKAKYARYTDPDYPILQVVEYVRDGVVIQRDRPIQVWGHANREVEVTVTLDTITKTAVANDRQQWSVTFPARKASADPIILSVESSHGHSRTVKDILVGDVWFLTGNPLLSSEWAHNPRGETEVPAAMPLVREFKRNTKASTFVTPRKKKFETGGGKYRSHWLSADWGRDGHQVTMFAYQFAKALDRPGVPQGFITMSSGTGGRNPSMASPLSWTSFAGIKDTKDPRFRTRFDALLLQDPASEIAMAAMAEYVDAVKAQAREIMKTGNRSAALAYPAFPKASELIDVKPDTIPTLAYNWCVSPFTPMAVSGLIWVPGPANIGHDPTEYAAELEVYANSLSGTYGREGQEDVPFLYAQPSDTLVEGISEPAIPGAKQVAFDSWPKSLEALAKELGALARD